MQNISAIHCRFTSVLSSHMKLNFVFTMSRCLHWLLTINMSNIISFATFCTKRTGHHVVGDEKTSVTMVLNKILWLEINANTSSNERMPARHRSLWWDWLCSQQFVSGLYSSHKYPQLNNGYGRFFPTYNMVACSLFEILMKFWWNFFAKELLWVELSCVGFWQLFLANINWMWGV